MLGTIDQYRALLREVIRNKQEQGFETFGLADRLEWLPESYDALFEFADSLAALPLRPDWPYVEPNNLDAIWDECDPDRPTLLLATIEPEEAADRVEAAFLGSVCGCILGKPLEVRPTLDEIRRAAQAIDEWPLSDYVSERLREPLGRLHGSWPETVRERIRYVAPDDDINYTVLGMRLLEEHGLALTRQDVMNAWLHNLPPRWTFGPERMLLTKAAMASIDPTTTEITDEQMDAWVTTLNPGDEKCGALIRADAYGYACPGRPALAAELAWRDASWTHRRTGIYGAMFVAAAIATAPVVDEPLEVFRIALQFVPQRSRFHHIVADSLKEVRQASDWLDGYHRIHGKYGQYGHCLVMQEVGTMINTLRFSEDVGDGICKQVMQGNDTDSFGATAGSILGAYFGPGYLDDRWLAPFEDTIHTTLAEFHEHSLTALARRMSSLPDLIAGQLQEIE